MPKQPYARIVADSISSTGHRLTSIEECYWRPVLAERNTHKNQPKNSASSRARPVAKILAELEEQLALPVAWPREQKGMQGGAEIEGDELIVVQTAWKKHGEASIAAAKELIEHGLHKSVVNRLLEPFMMHVSITTATAWINYFNQRAHKDAQPELRVVAEMSKAAYVESEPRLLKPGEWHLPYFREEDEKEYTELLFLGKVDEQTYWRELAQISAARVARTSYLTQDGVRDTSEDLLLFHRLTTERFEKKEPPHWSPLDHVATPDPSNIQSTPYFFTDLNGKDVSFPTTHLPRVGPLTGWRSLRTEVEGANGLLTYI